MTEPLEIEMNGTKPSGGTITIKDGQVTTDTTMTIGDYDVAYNPTVIYRWSEEEISIGDIIDDLTKYAQDNTEIGAPVYLKHILDKDNKVTESYACAKYDKDEYCLKGLEAYGWAENENDYTGNVLTLKKLQDWGADCYIDDAQSSCSIANLNLYTDLEGDIISDTKEISCAVRNDGVSSCNLS